MSTGTGNRQRVLPMTNKDWVRQPVSTVLWWGLPIAIGIGVSFLHLAFRPAADVCAALFGWMAIGCLLNAMRCHRVHCYISGPVLLLGAVFAALVALGLVNLSQRTFGNAVSVILILALLSFLPELLWKRYAR
jgi:hypothetical protein